MPLECFYCGHPLFLTGADDTCTNCGAPLTRQSASSPAPVAAQPSQALLPLAWPGDPTAFPSPVHRSAASPATRDLFGLPSSFSAQEAAITPSKADGPLPEKLAGSAALEGKVESTPTRNTVDVPLEWWSQGVLRLFFRPIFQRLSRYLLVVNNDSAMGGPPALKSMMTVYTLRIRRDDQTLAEARLEGDLIAGEPSLGDRVVLQGRYREETLVVQEGYNLSFHPPVRIRVRSPIPLRRARIAVMVLWALVLITLGCFVTFLPLFSYHAGAVHALGDGLMYLRQHYLISGSILAVLSYGLFFCSGWLIRFFLILFVVIALLAVYTALGGVLLPPLSPPPLHV